MNDLFKKYPLPWEMFKTLHGECLKAANGRVVIAEHKTLYIRDLLEVINSSIETEVDDFDDKTDKLLQGVARLIEISDDTNDLLRDIVRTLNDKFYGH